MGLPIDQLIVATNQNDILHRCIQNNDHSKQALQHSLSPSMDIMVSSNFERMLFDVYDRDGAAIRQLMEDFKSGKMTLSDDAFQRIVALFASDRLDDEQMQQVIAQMYDSNGYLLDPHTAIGVQAARNCRQNQADPMICLATAHPAKFPEAIEKSGLKVEVELPSHMASIMTQEERCEVLPNDLAVLQQYIADNCRKS